MIDQTKQLLTDGGNVIKTRDDRDLIFIDKDGKFLNSDSADWGLNPDDVVTNNEFRKRIEPWLTSLFQSEHLSLLCGSGITNAISFLAGANGGTTMANTTFSSYKTEIEEAATSSAKLSGRDCGVQEWWVCADWGEGYFDKVVYMMWSSDGAPLFCNKFG